MCAACAMCAVAGATGARSWLQAHHLTWLTPARLRRVTIGLCVLALGGSTLAVSGSSHAPRHQPAAATTNR